MKAKRDRGMRKDRLGFYAIALSSLFLGYIVFPAHVALGGDLPAGPAVQAGDPTITSDGQHMTVDAGSHDKTWIDWQGGFNIGANNSVNNIGPDASAVILHHDISGSVSNIQGALSGNCNVFLLNASGVLFAPGSQVNVGGLVVSTMHMSVDDFKAGRYVLNSDGIDKPGLIVNAGTITAQNPTGVTLAGGAVRNEGVINADLGTVNMVSGSEVTLKVNGDGSIQAVVNKAVLKNVYDKDNNRVTVGVDNVGDINAKGGQVFMEAEAVKDVFDTLINQQGVVKAGSMVNRNGKITLTSDSDGIVQNTGTLDTSAVEAGAKGGTIEMRGHKVGQFSMARADGANGGGEVTLRGRSVVTLGSGSVTTANAGASGTGGKVTVYSPEAALFKEGARIEAKGGTLSGDGGFVEVSGKTYLLFKGKVDASAPAGNAGTLLIDPGSLEIVTAGAGAPVWADHSDTFYYDSADSTKLSPTDIITELGSQNVLLLADNSITVTDIVSYNSANSLKLQTTSGGTVAVNAAITNAGTGDLILNAGSSNIVISANISTGGNIDIDTTSTFAVTAGSRVIGGGDGTTITVNARGITLGAGGNGTETLTNSGTGTISITSAGANDVTLNDYAIGNGTGLVSISSARDINGNGNATPDIQSSGSVTLTASGIGNTSTLAIGGTSSDDTLTVTNGAHNVSIIETANRFSTVSVFQCTTICSIDIDLYGADYIDIDPNAGAVELAQIITSAYNRNFIYNGSEAGAAVGVGALGPVNTGSGSLTITARGITGHAAMTVGGTLTMNTGSYAIDLSGYDNNIATLGAVTAGGGFNLNNGDNSVTLTGTINTSGSGSVTIDAGTGAIDTNDQIITAGSGAITLISDSIDLGTTANTIRTTGAVILETTTTDRTIGIAGGAGDYNLTAAEIAAIQNGASSITIGRTDSDADITIGAITFYDPVTIRAPNGGKVYVNGLITGLDNASISITGLGATTVLNANIVTAGNAITIDDSVRVGAAGGVTLDTTGSGVTAGNNITITGAVDSTLGHVYSLTLNGGTNGAVSIVGDTGTSDAIATFTVTSAAQVDLAKVRANTISVTGSSIDLNGTAYTALTDDVLFTGAVNLNSGGPITVTSGLGAGDDITFSSTINGVQSLDLIAGLGSVTVSSAVGGTTALNQFKITSAAQVDVGSITANTIDITGSDIDLNGTTYTALGSSITFNGPIAVIGAGTTTIMANGDIHLNGSLNGTVAGASSLTLDATNGTVYAEGLGATTALNVLNISGVAAQLNGNITVTSINTLEVGLTTLTNNITITASGGGGDVILLGNLAGASGLTLNANGVAHTGDIVLFDADINYLIISDARDVTFSGDFVTASDVTVANRRYITVSAGNSIQAGGAVSLIGDTVIDNGLIAGDSITISGATSIQLNGNVNGGNGLVHFVNPVRLTGDSVVSSANGNITFEGQLYGAYDIAINAPVGTVTLPMVGSDGRLTGLTVNANNLTLNSSVYVNGNIDVNVNSVTLGAGEIVITTTGSNGYIDFGTALIDAASGATVDLGITANGSGNVVLGTIGSLLPLHTISVATTSGITTLNGNITASGTGSNVIKLSGVPVIHLADNVTLRTTAAGDIVLTGGAIDGAYTLTVISGRDITTGAIGQNIKLESLSMTAARELTINGAISTLEDLRLIATTDDVNVGGALIGHDVYINAVAGSIIVSVAQNNTVGSITFNAGTLIDINATIQVLNNLTLESVSNVGGDLIAGDNIIINNEMTISGGARIFTVTYGNIDINANIMGGVNLTLSAVNGTIYVTTIGGTTPVAALVLISQYAQLGGNIYATSINTTSVGLTTLIANVTITTTGSGNVINLWDIDGAKNLTLIATNALGNIIVNNGNIAVLTITDGNGLTVNGNFIASGLVSVTGLTGTIAVGSGGSLQAGGGLTLTTSGGIVNNGLISGLSVTLTGATGIDLNGYIVVDYGVLELVSPVVLTGDTVISIANGTVIFDGDVSGPYVLTVNALNGHVTFLSTIGGGVDPLGLIIHADYLDLYGTVTVNGNIYVNANHIVLYTGAGIITTTGSNGYIDFDHALIDAATGAAIDLVITANGSGNVFLGTIGSLDPIRSLRVITGTGTTTLYGNIIADGIGANIINLSATSTIILGNDITVQTINAGDIVLTGGAIDGAHVLTVLSGRDIFVDGIGHTIPLTAVYMLAGRELTVNDYIYVVESLRLIATLDDINIGGNLIGHDVFVNAVAGSIIVSVAQNNTLGSITLTAGTLIDINVTIQELNNIIIESIVYVGGDLTAGDNIIINGVVHLTDGARIFTATHGFIDINANIMGAQNLTLSAINGTIYCSTIGDTTPVLALVLISQYAELYGNITVTSIDTTGVGLTTLTGDVIITASGSGNAIYLGPLAGTHGLTLVATNGAGNIIIGDGNIALFTITDGNNVTFNGQLVTSCGISVTGIDGDILVPTGESIVTGGSLVLTTPGRIINNGLISGGLVSLTGLTAIELNGTIIGGDGLIRFYSPVILTGNTIIGSANNSVQFDGDVSGPYVLTVNAVNGSVTFLSTIGGGVDPLGLIIHTDYLHLYGTVTVNGNIYVNANYIVFHPGSGIITTTGSNGYINLDHAFIDAATGAVINLVITANGSGNVFLGTIGSLDPIRSLQVITGTGSTTLYGNITADGIGTNIINLSTTSTIILGNDITIYTINAGDIVLTGGAIDHAYVLTVISGHDIFVGPIGQVIPLTAIYMIANNELTISGNIYVTESLRLIATIDDINIGGNLTGHDVFVTATAGSIIVSVAQNNTLGSITLTAGTLIDINVTIQELNNIIIESIVYVGGDLTAGDNIIINGVVHLTDGARIFTATHGFIDINASIEGFQNLTISAINGTIYVTTIGGTTPVAALVLISQYAELYGNITVTSIDTTGVGLTTLTNNITIIVSGSGNVINLGDLSGSNDLILTATNVSGSIIIYNANIASLTITDSFNVTFNGQFVTSCEINVYNVTGTITINQTISTGTYIYLYTEGPIIINALVYNAGTNITLISNTTYIDINYFVSDCGPDLLIQAQGDIDIDANIRNCGNITIHSIAGSINVAQVAPCVIISLSGMIDMDAGVNVLVGSASHYGRVMTTGFGSINIDAVNIISLTGTGSQVHSGGTLNIGQTTVPVSVSINDDGLLKAEDNLKVTGGTVTEAAAASITSIEGDIYLRSTTGAITLDGMTTAELNSIYLNSATTITDGTSGAADIIADALYLTSGGNIGSSGNYLDTKVSKIEDYSVTQHIGGNLYINEYDGVNLGSVNGLSTTAASNGSIFVRSNAGDDGALIASGVTAGGSGNVTLTSQAGAAITGNNNDISVGLITAAGGDVTLNANRHILNLNPDTAVDIVANGLYLQAGGSVGAAGSDQELHTRVATIDDMATGNVHGGINIIEYDGVDLGSVNGLTTDTGDINITAAKTATGDLTATLVTAGGAGNITLTTADGGGGGVSTNHIKVGLVTAAADDVTLISNGDIIDLDGGSTVDIVADALYLQAGGSVGTSSDYLHTRVSTIDDYTGGNTGGNIYISEYDGVKLGSLTTTTGLSTANGEMRVIAAATGDGTLTATKVTAGGTGKDLYLTTLNGAGGNNNIALGVVTAVGDNVILNADYDITNAAGTTTPNVVASGLYLSAGRNVGGPASSAEIYTTVDTIDNRTATDNVSGNIYIDETNAVTVGSINGLTTDAGAIDLDAGGTITVGTIAANGGYGITLNATAGDILAAPTSSITASGTSTFRASGIIGTVYEPVHVDVSNGRLWVWANGVQNETSVCLVGTVNSGSATERVEVLEPTPPGLVLYNDHLMGGGNYGSASPNGSILSWGYGYVIPNNADTFQAGYQRALQLWGYKMLLPWVLSEGAKIDRDFLNGTPVTIDVSQLNLPALQSDINKAADYFVIRSLR